MLRFRRLFALVLLALWLPVTQHCGLEAAGVFDHAVEGEGNGCCQGGATPCSEDNCELLENGAFRPAGDSLAVPAPILTARVCLLCAPLAALVLPVTDLAPGNDTVERPRNWVPTWQFVQRAALSPRAPSLV